MNGNEFLEKLELINPEFIEEADIKPRAKKQLLIKWVALAACICFVLTAGIFAAKHFNLFHDNSDTVHKVVVQHSAAGFYLSENKEILYFPISFDNRVRYGLVPEDAEGLTEENTYKITDADIGELMGIVTSCGDKELIGCNVYHFSKFPNYDSICIVETKEGYMFYTGTYFTPSKSNMRSDVCLAVFDLPNSLEKIEITNDERKVLFEIKDENEISALFKIILNKYDIGNNELNRRKTDAWYNKYHNDDLYYDESTGQIVYKNQDQIIKEGYTSIVDGVEIVYEPQFADTVIRDKAIELWNKDNVNISIISNNGFGVTIIYSPITSTFNIFNNNYSLTENEVKELNSILKITE